MGHVSYTTFAFLEKRCKQVCSLINTLVSEQSLAGLCFLKNLSLTLGKADLPRLISAFQSSWRSLHSGDWSPAAAKGSKHLDGLFAQLFLVTVRTATRPVLTRGKIMSLGAKKPACWRMGRGMRKQHCTVPGYSSSHGRNFKAIRSPLRNKSCMLCPSLAAEREGNISTFAKIWIFLHEQ